MGNGYRIDNNFVEDDAQDSISHRNRNKIIVCMEVWEILN